MISTEWPFRRMSYNSCTDYVEIYIDGALSQMFISFNCCCVIPVFPISTLPFFPLVELLSGSFRYQSNRFGNNIPVSIVSNEKMDVIGSDCVAWGQAMILIFIDYVSKNRHFQALEHRFQGQKDPHKAPVLEVHTRHCSQVYSTCLLSASH